MSKKISVIIPNYNDLRIERALKSLQSQSNPHFELIIVDGNSKDQKVHELYNEFSARIDLLIVESDQGLFDALNKGIAASTGDFIYLMGADDFLNDINTFATIYKEMAENEFDGYCIGARFFTNDGKVIREWMPRKVNSTLIGWGIFPPHFSLFLSKKIYAEVGDFDLSKGTVGADSYWMLLMGKKNYRIKVVKDLYLNMEQGGTSTGSFKNILIAFKNIAVTAKGLGYANWILIPIVKVLVKLPQFLMARKIPKLF
jgi:glycosyltransferase involved in cell wall biosynthesis